MAPTNAQANSGSSRLVAITERSFAFSVRILNLCRFLETRTHVSKTLINQLLRAATSVGANLEEAVAAQSKADFIHKNAIALKEARESNYWLRLIAATNKFSPAVTGGITQLEGESIEISKIIAKRIISSKKTRQK